MLQVKYSIFIVISFVEMAKFLLSNSSSGLFLLSERLSQDPLENYFGQQSSHGGRNENPKSQQCQYKAAAAIRVQKSMATDPVRGNCSHKRRLYTETPPDIDATPYLSENGTQKLYNISFVYIPQIA